MELMQWHDEFSVGVNVIDQQHQQLFAMINELIVAVNSHQQKEVLDRLLTAKLDYVKTHFKMEEGLFKIHPQFKEYCTPYQDFEQIIRELSCSFFKEKSDLANIVLNELTSWFLNHLPKKDIKFVQ
jgi:hemerythrin-like metal-binding protein